MIRTPGQSSQLSEGDRKRTVSYCSRDSSGEEGKEEDSLSSGSSSSIGDGGSVRENLVDGSHREVVAVTDVDLVVEDGGRVRSTGLDEGGTDDSVREDGTSEPGVNWYDQPLSKQRRAAASASSNSKRYENERRDRTNQEVRAIADLPPHE
jgi:hypothetical protein